jgi:hypothetical protein
MSITNIEILDCNRLNSEEAKSDNNENYALWHNKLGSGVQISPGDKIQVSGTFISERGAGDNVIEFSGKSLKNFKDILYTEQVGENACRTITQGYEYVSRTNDNLVNKENFDNKATISYNIYKTANGENTFQLPRKFMAMSHIVNAGTQLLQEQVWMAQETSIHLGSDNTDYGPSGGLPFHQVPFFTGPSLAQQSASRTFFYVEEDYKNNYRKIQDNEADDQGDWNEGTENYFKLRTDGTRYMIYGMKETYYSALSAQHEPPASYWDNEPSDKEYIRIYNNVDIELPIGFDSPSSVATNITNQLRKTGKMTTIDYPNQLGLSDFKPPKPMSCFIESETFKIFNSANIRDMLDTTYITYNGIHSDAVPEQTTIDWINAHEFIGVKRPDLWDAGKDFNANIELDGDTLVLETDLIMNGTYEWINTNILWNDANFTLLNNLFKAQSNYPELFHCYNNDYGNGERQSPLTAPLTDITTNRFLHINPFVNQVHDYTCVTQYYNNVDAWVIKDETWGAEDIVGYYVSGTNITDRPYVTAYDPATKILTFSSGQNFVINLTLYLHPPDEETILGTDDISGSNSFRDVQDFNRISLPLMFYFDESASLTQKSGWDQYDLNYGYSAKRTLEVGDTTYEYISFWISTETAGWHPPDLYFENNNGGHGSGTTIYAPTLLGWDNHWTAYSTCVIGLCDGWVDNGYPETLWRQGLNAVWDDVPALSPADISFNMKKSYLGSNEPLMEFDTDTKKFNLQQLHTPEYIGNDYKAGGTDEDTSIPINVDASDKVYKINKRFQNVNWTPALIPFSNNEVSSSSGTTTYNLSLLNSQVDAFKIFDSNSGIIISDFGVDESVWNDSLWGILGFTYNQFNNLLNKDNNITQRITEETKNNLHFVMTNADVNAGQSVVYNVNGWGVPMYNAQLPISYIWNGVGQDTGSQLADGTRMDFPIQNYPAITEKAISIKLQATNLPRKMLKPYYCIRSDILDKSYYLGGQDSGQSMNCVAIINKINGFGDFYFSEESPYVFTATQRKVLTSITTSIHSPDQKYAHVNSDSAVIYKIIKEIPAQMDILDQILEATKPKK